MKTRMLPILLAIGTTLLRDELPSSPDMIVTNARIWTANPAQPVAEALAIRGDRIISVGTGAEIRRLAGPQTNVVDLHGKLVVPGFIDAGVNLIEGGMHLYQFHAGAARNPEELRARVREYAANLPNGRWIVATDWDDRNWSHNKPATREILDAVTGDHPAVIVTLDGRLALANTIALRLANITKAAGLPPDGGLYRDNKGEPTGLLIGSAIGLVERVIPPPCVGEVEDFLRLAMRHAAENGITSVQDQTPSPQYARIWRELARQGELTLRITRQATLTARTQEAEPAFRSGWDLGSLDPLGRIYAAVTSPAGALSVDAALRAYTFGGAWVAAEDGEKGTLETGKLADLVVLSDDILAQPCDRIRAARVIRTIVGGRVVYDRATGYQAVAVSSI